MSEAAHQHLIGREVRLGKQEVKHDDRTLRLANYLTPALPPPPATLARIASVQSVLGHGDWGMMGNDTLGDCTCAALGHAEQTWAAIALGVSRTPTDRSVEDLYWRTGDGSRQDDIGRVELDVLNYIRKHGVFRHKVHAFVKVGRSNFDLVKQAMLLFGGAYIGLSLPKSAQLQPTWDVISGPDSRPGSWGGHAVWLVDYDEWGPTCITWGQPLKMSWAFYSMYCDEAYALVESEWFKRGHTPAGFDLKALVGDLEAIR